MSTYQFNYELTGNSNDFTAAVSKAERSVEGFEKATNKADKTTKRMGDQKKRIDGLKKSFAGLGTVVAGLGVGLAFKKLIENTTRQEDAITQLNAALDSTQFAAGKTSKELQDMATSLQGVTRFGDEAIIEMQSLLLTFKDIKGDNFDRTTEAVLDMATAMKVDLKSASLQLGKALNDPAKNLSALSRAGITFSETQIEVIKHMQATGDMAGAQTLILKELESQFGGSAKAARETLGGALEGLSNAWGDLFEAEQEATEGMKESINELEDLFTDPQFKQSLNYLVKALIDIANAAAKAVAGLVNLGKSIGENLAKAIHGITIDDVPALEKRLGELNGRLEDMAKHGQTAGYTVDSIKREIRELEQKLELANFAQRNLNNSVDELAPIVVTASRVTNDLSGETEELAEITVTATRKVHDLKVELSGVTEETEKAAKAQPKLKEAATDTADAVTDSFIKMWDGALDEDYVLGKFKSILAKMIGTAFANPITIGLGLSGGSGMAYGAGGGGGGFSLGGASSAWSAAKTGWSALSGSGLSTIGGAYQGFGNMLGSAAQYVGTDTAFGNFLGNVGLDSTSRGLSIQYGGAGWGDLAATAGAGIVGSIGGTMIGQNLFNKQAGSSWGATAGSAIGSIWGPWGAAIGGALGGLVDSAFGRSKTVDNRGARVDLDLATGYYGQRGRLPGDSKFSQRNYDSVNSAAQMLQLFDSIVGGSGQSFNLQVGDRRGMRLNGKEFSSMDALISSGFQQILDSAQNLDPVLKTLMDTFRGTAQEALSFSGAVASLHSAIQQNPVEAAVADFAAAQEAAGRTLYNSYQLQLDSVRELVANFDGSAIAADQLNNALLSNQQAAYNLAIGIQGIAEQMGAMFGTSAQAIRESILTDAERIASWEARLSDLRGGLSTMIDPEEIQRAGQEINTLVNRLFGSLDSPTNAEAEFYAGILDSTSEVAKIQLDKSLENVRTTQEEIAARVDTMLTEAASRQQEAANTMYQAAELSLEASQNLFAAMQALGLSTSQVSR